MEGTTGTDLDFFDVEIAFGPAGECTTNGWGWVVTCEGTARVLALDGASNLGTLNLNEGFRCDFLYPFNCMISVVGPQDPDDQDAVLDLLGEGWNPSLDVTASFRMTRTGAAFCGAREGVLTLTGDYEVEPDDFAMLP